MSKLPKQRGIQSTKPKYVVVSLAFLDASFSAKDIVTPRALLSRGIRVREARGLKILGTGKITKALTVHAHAFSSSAKRAIEQAGGRAVKLARI
jgi:large subunit ribosomal protein L15